MPQMNRGNGGGGSMGSRGNENRNQMGGFGGAGMSRNEGRNEMGGRNMQGMNAGNMGNHRQESMSGRRMNESVRRPESMPHQQMNDSFRRPESMPHQQMNDLHRRPESMPHQRMEEPFRPEGYRGNFGRRPHHALPFGLIAANIVWNRMHFTRVRRILEEMVYGHPISPIQERILVESFGRPIEYYEAQSLLEWVDRELGYF